MLFNVTGKIKGKVFSKPLLLLGCFVAIGFCIWGTDSLNKYVQEHYYSKSWYRYPAGANVRVGKSGARMYTKSAHVSENVTVSGENYLITFTFKDHKNQLRECEMQLPKSYTDKSIYKFGLPGDFFEPYYDTPEVRAERAKALKEGMWSIKGSYARPDLNAMTNTYKNFGKPIAQYIEQAVGSGASMKTKIDFALRFCQDIPYGQPPEEFNGRKCGGIFPPPQSLVNMFADCDSKSVLLACIARHFGEHDMIYIHVPGHLLMGLKGIPGPYDDYIEYEGNTYLYMEPSGPGRLSIGQGGQEYSVVRSIARVD